MSLLKTKKTNAKRFEKVKMKEQRPLSLMFDADILRRFKVKTAMQGENMTEVLTKAIRAYLA